MRAQEGHCEGAVPRQGMAASLEPSLVSWMEVQSTEPLRARLGAPGRHHCKDRTLVESESFLEVQILTQPSSSEEELECNQRQ